MYETPKMPEIALLALTEMSKSVPMDCTNNPYKAPSWLDKDKFERGRRFYQKYYFGCVTAAFSGLLLLLAIPEILNTLVCTGQSDTKKKALCRYLATVRHMDSWFRGDVWKPNDKALLSILHVRRIHSEVNERIMKIIKHGPSNQHVVPFSQYTMTMTLFGFMGLVVLYPRKYGIRPNAQELEGFVHFWRTIGYLQGIVDRYNFCRDTYQETVNMCEHLLGILKSELSNAPSNYLAMVQASMEGIKVVVPLINFESFLARTYHVIGYENEASATKSMPLTGYSWYMYHFMNFVFNWLLIYCPCFITIYNGLLHVAICLTQAIWIK